MINLNKIKILLATAVITLVAAKNVQAASYTVAKGDSLFTIGKLFNTSYISIQKDNKLSGDIIYPGQILNVPGQTYIVKSGDTLFTIAKRYNIPLASLQKANNKWDSHLYIGQKLVLPGVQSNTSTVTPTNEKTSVIPYTAADLDLLARLITAEAENQPYSAKVAVGAVVINRVKSTIFPNTLNGVIYEKSYGYYQFTPTQNGYINKPASEAAKKAAYEALHGNDPTNGALYYFDDSTTNQWLWSKPISIRIDRMIFSY